MENASSQAQHSGGQQGGAQVPLPPKKASSDRGKKQMEMGGGCGGAGRRRRRTLTRAGLHSTTVACVPQQPRRMGIVVGAGPAGIPSAGGSDRSFFCMRCLGARHVGRRRCWLVNGGLGGGRPRGAALSVARRAIGHAEARGGRGPWTRCPGPVAQLHAGPGNGGKVAVCLWLRLAVVVLLHG